jgi:ribosome-binding factor A
MPAEKKGDGNRPARVATQLKQELARLVSRGLSDPRLEGVVVADVTMSPDLRNAKVFFRLVTTATGNELDARRDEAAEGLERAKGRLRKAVTTALKLRFAPELRFFYDEGQEARDRIERLLGEVATEAAAARKRDRER